MTNGWILREISPEPEELFFGSNQMIKAILLPESAALAKASVDLSSREVLPWLALLQHAGLIRKCRQ